MAFFGLVDYGADSGDEDQKRPAYTDSDEEEGAAAPVQEEEEYDEELMSLKTVAERRALLLQRAKGKKPEPEPEAPKLALPSALDALGAHKRGVLPAHLDPEATRRIPGQTILGSRHFGNQGAEEEGEGQGEEDVIGKLAPKLAEERKRPAAVISAAPKRAKIEDDDEGLGVNPLALAAIGAAPPPRRDEAHKKATKAVPYEDFVAKGGNAKLPRNSEKQKDKEKNRRMKGQSTFDRWKSEEEFALRQNYDS